MCNEQHIWQLSQILWFCLDSFWGILAWISSLKKIISALRYMTKANFWVCTLCKTSYDVLHNQVQKVSIPWTAFSEFWRHLTTGNQKRWGDTSWLEFFKRCKGGGECVTLLIWNFPGVSQECIPWKRLFYGLNQVANKAKTDNTADNRGSRTKHHSLINFFSLIKAAS